MEINKKKNREPNWSEKMKVAGFKFKYKALGYMEEIKPSSILQSYETLYLLGRKFEAKPENNQQINKLIYTEFNSIPWITYRTGFPELRGSGNQTYISDAGWGCMIRVGQMYMAQILKKFLILRTKQDIVEVLKHFQDYSEQKQFSIQNIVRVAEKVYKMQPGKWYNPSQIVNILSEIYQEMQKQRFNNKLFFIVFNNSNLFLQTIVSKFTESNLCKCYNKKLICEICHPKNKRICASILVLCRIGLDKPQKKYLQSLNKMIESPYFQGIIGGKPEKALYIVGKHIDQYVYLDPHIVQEAVCEKNFSLQRNSYFCESFRKCSMFTIDPSLAIGFYVQSLQQVEDLYNFLFKIKNQCEDFFIYLSERIPKFLKQQQQEISQKRKKRPQKSSEDFQLIN